MPKYRARIKLRSNNGLYSYHNTQVDADNTHSARILLKAQYGEDCIDNLIEESHLTDTTNYNGEEDTEENKPFYMLKDNDSIFTKIIKVIIIMLLAIKRILEAISSTRSS